MAANLSWLQYLTIRFEFQPVMADTISSSRFRLSNLLDFIKIMGSDLDINSKGLNGFGNKGDAINEGLAKHGIVKISNY